MYGWETVSDNVQNFQPGNVVRLNPAWSGFAYLQKEFGHLFPRYVKRVAIDIVELEGKMALSFARQCLTKNRH